MLLTIHFKLSYFCFETRILFVKLHCYVSFVKAVMTYDSLNLRNPTKFFFSKNLPMKRFRIEFKRNKINLGALRLGFSVQLLTSTQLERKCQDVHQLIQPFRIPLVLGWNVMYEIIEDIFKFVERCCIEYRTNLCINFT